MQALGAIVAILLITASTATAQVTTSRGYIGVKGGLHAERAEDNLRGASAGGGMVAGVRMTGDWTLDGELWIPGHIDAGTVASHRDILFGVGFRRSFGTGVQPHLLFGMHAGRTEDSITTCSAIRSTPSSGTPAPVLVSCDEPDVTERITEHHSTVSLFPLLGAGVQIPLTERLLLIPDLRLQLWITSVIVRPAVTIALSF